MKAVLKILFFCIACIAVISVTACESDKVAMPPEGSTCKDGHTEEIIVGYEATCTREGLTDGKRCAICDLILKEQQTIEKKDHVEETIPGCEATCTVRGYTEGKKCSVCNTVLVKSEKTEMKPHTEKIIYGFLPTCTVAGLTDGIICAVCNTTLLIQEEIAPTGHTEEILSGYDATCTKPGRTDGRYCTVCNDLLVPQQQIAPLGHKEEKVYGYEATCTEEGLKDGVICSVCDEILIAQQKIAPGNHIEEYVKGYAATCTKSGLTNGIACSECHEILVEQEEIKPLGHCEAIIYGYEATCTEDGLTDGKECTVCGDTLAKQEVIKANGHTESIIEGYDATCTSPGFTDGAECSVCGTLLSAQELIPAKKHTYDDDFDESCNNCEFKREVECPHTETEILAAKAPTCTTSGYTEGVKCKKCEAILEEQAYLPSPGHNEVTIAGKEATCTESGLTSGLYCSVCDTTLVEQKPIEKRAHNLILSGGSEPTCTEPGYTASYHCIDCDYVEAPSEEIPATGHVEKYFGGKDATCTEPGLTRGKHCIVCNEILAKETVIAPKGHTEKILPGYAPTCTYNGLTDRTYCSICGTTIIESETIAATGHTAVVDTAIAPTCTEAGKTEGSHCSVCGEILVHQNYIAPLSHDYVTVNQKDPTCTEPGNTYGLYCSLCDEVFAKSEEIAAKGHSTIILEGYDATCTEDGLTDGKYCYICDKTYEPQSAIRAYGHNEVTDSEVDSTCSLMGLTEGSHCSRCNEIFTEQKKTLALGHTYNGGYCSVCGDKKSTPDEYFIFELTDDGTYRITDLDPEKMHPIHLRLPDVHEGRTVTEIALYALNSVYLKRVYIPAEITYVAEDFSCSSALEKIEIASDNQHYTSLDGILYSKDMTVLYAYPQKKALESLLIPDSVEAIKPYAFFYSSPEKIIFSDSSNLKRIESYAFYNCDAITSIILPEGLETVEAAGFYKCRSLASVYIPASLGDFYGDMLEYCSYENVTVSHENPYIKKEGSALYTKDGSTLIRYFDRDGVSEYEFPQSVSKIGKYAFSENENLKTVIIPDRIEAIGEYAFTSCKNLKTLRLPRGIEWIQKHTFSYCYALTEIEIPDTVQTIGDHAFMQATTDPTLVVYVPESVSSVGQQAFNGLLCVYFEHESKDDVSLAPNDSGAAHQVWNYNATDEDTPLDCFEFTLLDDGTYSIAVKTPERISVRLTIPSTYLGKPVTVISKAAFYECRRIKTVVIPNSIKRIEAEAFSQCTQLCEVDFGVVEFIGEKAFAYTALTEVTLPDTVILTEESHGIFTAAGQLKKADISRVQADLIPANLFASCCELIEVRLPDTASTIEYGVFYQCNSLKNLTLPAQTKEIASNAFYNCTSLESVTVPTTLMKIEDNAFDKCSSLSSFDLPEGFTSLGNYAFQGCGLTEFYIPSSVSFIGYAPFNSAMKLEKIEVATDNKYYTSVNGVLYNKAVTNMYQYPCAKPDTYFELPETVTSVLSYAMNDADNLTEINLKNAETLQFHSLGGCDGLKSIELPDTLSFFERCALDGSAIERLVIPDGIDRLPAMTISIGDLKSSGLSLPKLKTVVIGKSLSDIEGLFHFTPSLESFEVSEENPYFKAIDGHLYDKSGTVLHRYAKAKAVGTVKIPEGVVVVASEAFFECNKLEKVVFSSTVKEIGKYAFSQCELLSEIELTNGIISIEKAAFYYVPLLKGVYIPESVEYVDYYAFYFAKYVLTNAKEIPSDWHLDTDVVITDYCVEHDEFYGFHEH